MFVVCVTFRIKPGAMDQFMPLMRRQARNSVDLEQECQRFDVCSGGTDPDAVFLYEIYTDHAAFQAHLDSPHFQSFDTAVSDLIDTKTMATYGILNG